MSDKISYDKILKVIKYGEEEKTKNMSERDGRKEKMKVICGGAGWPSQLHLSH